MKKTVSLILDGANHLRVIVANIEACNASIEVDIFVPVNVFDQTALRRFNNKRIKPSVRRRNGTFIPLQHLSGFGSRRGTNKMRKRAHFVSASWRWRHCAAI